MGKRRVIVEHRTVLKTDPKYACEMSGCPGPQETRVTGGAFLQRELGFPCSVESFSPHVVLPALW